uniref:Ig-like domain-containing protein n=1 Tax=Meloidogyne hapla TaxID=6305 RepID=A0A1I8C2V2_MELHA
MRPVLILNASTRLDHKEDGNFFHWIGSAKTTSVGDDVLIECPVIGYPLPEIRWFKDDKPLNTSALLPPDKNRKTISSRRKYVLTAKALYIRSVDQNDEGTYKCLATNSFTVEFGQSPREFQLTLEHYLRIPSTMSWIIPLIIIIASLILLALTIWGCSQRDRSKRNQYNVAQKEKEHFRASGGEGGRPPTDELED